MSDAEQNRRALLQVETLLNDVFIGSVVAAHESIKVGSPVTGAPGQPVDVGNLRNSWLYEFDNPTHPTSAVIGTPVEYAELIEDGVGRFGPLTLRSKVGGFHSVAQTIAGFPRLVAQEKARVERARGIR